MLKIIIKLRTLKERLTPERSFKLGDEYRLSSSEIRASLDEIIRDCEDYTLHHEGED